MLQSLLKSTFRRQDNQNQQQGEMGQQEYRGRGQPRGRGINPRGGSERRDGSHDQMSIESDGRGRGRGARGGRGRPREDAMGEEQSLGSIESNRGRGRGRYPTEEQSRGRGTSRGTRGRYPDNESDQRGRGRGRGDYSDRGSDSGRGGQFRGTSRGNYQQFEGDSRGRGQSRGQDYSTSRGRGRGGFDQSRAQDAGQEFTSAGPRGRGSSRPEEQRQDRGGRSGEQRQDHGGRFGEQRQDRGGRSGEQRQDHGGRPHESRGMEEESNHGSSRGEGRGGPYRQDDRRLDRRRSDDREKRPDARFNDKQEYRQDRRNDRSSRPENSDRRPPFDQKPEREGSRGGREQRQVSSTRRQGINYDPDKQSTQRGNARQQFRGDNRATSDRGDRRPVRGQERGKPNQYDRRDEPFKNQRQQGADKQWKILPPPQDQEVEEWVAEEDYSDEDEQEYEEEQFEKGPIKTVTMNQLIEQGRKRDHVNQEKPSRFYREEPKINIIKDPILDDFKTSDTQKSTSSRPTLEKGAYRLINAELRKNDYNLPRTAPEPTRRDNDGKRVDHVQFQPKAKPTLDLRHPEVKPLKQETRQVKPLVSDGRSVVNQKLKKMQEKMTSKRESKILPIEYEEHLVRNFQDGFDSISSISVEQEDYCEMTLVSAKITQDELKVLKEQNLFDDIFEVNLNTRQPEDNKAISKYFRSNQGKVNKSIRNIKGMEIAVNYLIQNIINAEIEQEPKFIKSLHHRTKPITFSDVFQYADDRFRAIQNDLTKLQSVTDVNHQNIPILEKIIRFYMVSLFQFNCMKSSGEYGDDKSRMSDEGKQTMSDDLKQIMDGITKCSKALEDYLTSLVDCYLEMFDTMRYVKEYLARKRTLGKSKNEILGIITRKFKLQVSPNVPEFLSYAYIIQMLKREKFQGSTSRLCEMISSVGIHCPIMDELTKFKDIQFFHDVQDVFVTKNLRKLVMMVSGQDHTFHQKLLLALISMKLKQYYEQGEAIFTGDVSIYDGAYYFQFDEIIEEIHNEFFNNQEFPRSKLKLNSNYLQSRDKYIMDPLDREYTFLDAFLNSIMGSVRVAVPRRPEVIRAQSPVLSDLESGEVMPEVIVETAKHPQRDLKLERATKRWRHLALRSQWRSAIADLKAPLAEHLEHVESLLVKQYILRWRFAKLKLNFLLSKKQKWIQSLIETQPLQPLKNVQVDLSRVKDILESQQQQQRYQNYFYQVLEMCINQRPNQHHYNFKVCVVVSQCNHELSDLHSKSVDKFISGLIQQDVSDFTDQFREHTLSLQRLVCINDRAEGRQSLRINFVFIQAKALDSNLFMLHGCDQLIYISSDNLRADREFFLGFQGNFDVPTIPLHLLILFPNDIREKYLNADYQNTSLTLSSGNHSFSENAADPFRAKKHDFLRRLGLMDESKQSTVFKHVEGVRVKLSTVDLYNTLFDQSKFKAKYLQSIKFSIFDKLFVPRHKLISLSSIFQGLQNVLASKSFTCAGVQLAQSISNEHQFISLIAHCDFIEKCLEDLLETHLRYFLVQRPTGCLLNAIPYDMDFRSSRTQLRFIRACRSSVLKVTKRILVKLNPTNLILKQVVALVKRNIHNLNSIDMLNFVRKTMKLCDRITKQKKFGSVNFAGYQRFFETKFTFGNQDRNYLEGNWVQLFHKIIGDVTLLLKKSKIYFIVPYDYQYTVDEEVANVSQIKQKLNKQIQDDYSAYLKDIELIKQRLYSQRSSKRDSVEIMGRIYNYDFENWLKQRKLDIVDPMQ